AGMRRGGTLPSPFRTGRSAHEVTPQRSHPMAVPVPTGPLREPLPRPPGVPAAREHRTAGTADALPAWGRTVHRFARALTPDEFVVLPPAAYGATGLGKLELVDGQVVEMPPVGGAHTDIADDLRGLLAAHVETLGGESVGRVRKELAYRLVLPPAHA